MAVLSRFSYCGAGSSREWVREAGFCRFPVFRLRPKRNGWQASPPPIPAGLFLAGFLTTSHKGICSIGPNVSLHDGFGTMVLSRGSCRRARFMAGGLRPKRGACAQSDSCLAVEAIGALLRAET
jgi:hypothetical protein